MGDTVNIQERWTATHGWRKIADGPWEPIDLTLLGDKVPIVFLGETEAVSWTEIMSKQEALMKWPESARLIR